MRSPAPSQKDFWGPRTLLSMSAKDLRGWCRGSRWQPCSTMPSRSSAGNLCRTDAAEAAPKGYIHLLTVGERIGGDNRPTLRNSLVSRGPDLARGSEVFYYSSAGFLTVWRGQPSSQ